MTDDGKAAGGGRRGTGAAGALLRYAPSRFAEPALSLLALPVLTRTLGTEGYGVLAVVLLSAGMVRNVFMEWVSTSALRFRTPMAGDLDRFHTNIAASLLLAGAAAVLLLVPLRGVLVDTRLAVVGLYFWWVLADAAVSAGALTGEAVLRATHRPVAFTVSRGLQAASRHLLALAGLLILARGIDSYMAFRVAGLALVGLWSWRTIGAFGHLRPARFSWATQRELLVFGLPLAVSLLTNTLRMMGNQYVVLWIEGPEGNGLFAAAANIGIAPVRIFQQIVMLGLYPLAIDAWERQESIGPIVRDGLRYYLLGAVPALAGIALLARPILGTVAGAEFAPAAPVLVLLSISMFAYGLSQYFSMLLMVRKETTRLAVIGLVAGGLNLGLSAVLVARYGYVAAAAAAVVANVLLLAATMVWGLRPSRETVPYGLAGRVALATALMAAAVLLVGRLSALDGVPGLVAGVATGVVAYGAAIVALGELRGEWRAARRRWAQLRGRDA